MPKQDKPFIGGALKPTNPIGSAYKPIDPGECPFVACDHSCVCNKAKGQATNGHCRCDERTLRRAIRWWRAKAKYLEYHLDKVEDELSEVKNDLDRESLFFW